MALQEMPHDHFDTAQTSQYFADSDWPDVADVTLFGPGSLPPAAAQAKRIYLSPPKLRRVIAFIEAHLHESIGLDDLARAAGLSANHFLRVFKLATGETPYHFLRTRRLERARHLLAEDAMPLAELALECGFANQAHFTAAFSREIGISPGRYRRALRD